MRRSILAVAAATVLASLVVAGTASAQTTIQPGRTVNGELTSRDARWDGDNTPMDCYVLQTTAGQSYVIDYRSDAFDAFLAVGRGRNCQGGNQTAFDDDSGGGLHSRLTLAGDGQVWFIRANAIAETSAGAYTLAVSGTTGAAPSRPVGKPPAGGAAPVPARPTPAPAPAPAQSEDETSIYEFLSLCMAADIVQTQQGVRDTPAREAESMQIFELLMMAGAEEGQSEDQMTEMVAGLAAAWMNDAAMLRESPPATVRQNCLDMINAS